MGRTRGISAAFLDRGLLRAVLLAFALFLAYRFLAQVATMVLLLAAALLLAVILSAPVEALHRRNVSRALAAALIVLCTLAVLGLSGYLLLPTLTRQAAQLASDLPGALTQLIERVRELARGYGFQVGGGGGFSASTFSNVAGQVLGGALGLFGGLASLFTAVLILTIVPIYLAAQPEPAVGWFIRFFPPDRRDRVREVLSKVRSGLLLWLKGRIADMAIVGILSTVALYLIGVPGALFLGILTGLLAFVPLVGSIVSAIPPLLLAFVVGPTTVLWVLVAYVAIQQIEGNLVEPLIMQKTASLHPAAVVTVVTVLGAAFGVLGSILAVPSAIVAAILVKELWFRRLEEARTEPNRNAGNEGTPEKPRQTVRDA
jgi:predicted PurR-regulated permease PerM